MMLLDRGVDYTTSDERALLPTSTIAWTRSMGEINACRNLLNKEAQYESSCSIRTVLLPSPKALRRPLSINSYYSSVLEFS